MKVQSRATSFLYIHWFGPCEDEHVYCLTIMCGEAPLIPIDLVHGGGRAHVLSYNNAWGGSFASLFVSHWSCPWWRACELSYNNVWWGSFAFFFFFFFFVYLFEMDGYESNDLDLSQVTIRAPLLTIEAKEWNFNFFLDLRNWFFEFGDLSLPLQKIGKIKECIFVYLF